MGKVIYYDEWRITKEIPLVFRHVEKYCERRFRDTEKDCLTFVPPTIEWGIAHGEDYAPKALVEMSPVLRLRLISMCLIMVGTEFNTNGHKKAGILSLKDFERNRVPIKKYIREVRERYAARKAKRDAKLAAAPEMAMV